MNLRPLRPLFPGMHHLGILLLLASLPAASNEVSNLRPGEPLPRIAEKDSFGITLPVPNPYDRALKVKQIDSTCACSVLKMDERFLLPGGSSPVVVKVENRNRSGDQKVQISLYLSDPELEPIEVMLRWTVLPAVTVDAIAPGNDPAQRPTEPAWQDVYKYVVNERPDELNRLRKRIRIASPEASAPPGGLRIEGVDYAGSLWAFTPRELAPNVWLLTASAREPDQEGPEGAWEEQVTVRTNHPDKAKITLIFQAVISKKAGQEHFDPMVPLPPM